MTDKYIVYKTDLKFKKNRNINPDNVIWNDLETEQLYYKTNLDTVEYRIHESYKENKLYLDLSGLNLSQFPDNIPNDIIINVKYLFLDNNELISLPNLSSFINLEVLDISYNKIKYIHYLPPSLIELCCQFNLIEYIPDSPKLERLICNNNKLKNIGNFPNLIILHCHFNLINSINNIHNIKTLICFNNNLSYINKYKFLTYLDCSSNNISQLNLYDELVDLICNYNSIKSLHIFPKLKYLETFGNKIDKLEYMNNLKELYCNINTFNQISNKYSIKTINKNNNNNFLIFEFN